MPFSFKACARLCIARPKEAGATEYVIVDVGVWDGKGGPSGARNHGELARKIVDAAYPGVIHVLDSDKSDWSTGKLAILLPKTPAVIVSGQP